MSRFVTRPRPILLAAVTLFALSCPQTAWPCSLCAGGGCGSSTFSACGGASFAGCSTGHCGSTFSGTRSWGGWSTCGYGAGASSRFVGAPGNGWETWSNWNQGYGGSSFDGSSTFWSVSDSGCSNCGGTGCADGSAGCGDNCGNGDCGNCASGDSSCGGSAGCDGTNSDCGCSSGSVIGESVHEGTVIPGLVHPEHLPADNAIPHLAPTDSPPASVPAPVTPAPTQPGTDDDPLFENEDMDEGVETPPAPAPNTEADPGTDDLFPPLEEEPAAPTEENTDDLDDLFGANLQRAPLSVALDQQPWRNWIDDTGWYETRGQLVSVTDTVIRLHKDNGNHCTVPLERLSQADIAYVKAVVRQAAGRDAVRIAGR